MSRTLLPRSARLRWKLLAQTLIPGRGRRQSSGQSLVFRVERISDGTRGVLKVPNARPDQVERLAREIRVLGQLSHPALIPVLDCNCDPEDLWPVTPLGSPLDE